MGSRALKAGEAFLEFSLKDGKIRSQLRKLQKRFAALGAGLQRLGRIGLKMGAALAVGLALPLRVFANFDDRMRVVKAVTGSTAKEFQLLRDEAKRLGRETSFSASQVADAMSELGRAGFKPTEVLKSTQSVLDLSRATDTELPRAAEIAGAALRGFGLEVSQMERVTDVLTATANGSAQTLEDLFESMKSVAPIASEAGESIEETGAALAILANNGIKGSLAGSALARAYKNLSATKTESVLAGIGVSAKDSADNLIPLIDIMASINTATADLGEAKRLAIFEQLFGRGQAAALKLAKSSGEEFSKLVGTIRDSGGIAASTAREMDAGIGGAFRRLLSATEGIAIALGEVLTPVIEWMAGKLTVAAAIVTRFVETYGRMIRIALISAAAFVAVSTALFGAGLMFSLISVAIGGIISAIAATMAVFGALGSALAVVGGIIATAITSPLLIVGASIAFVAHTFTNVTSAAGAMATNVGGSIGELLSGPLGTLMGWFGKLKATALDAFSAISAALAKGDIAAAGNILWAALQLMWLQGTAGIRQKWNEMIGGIIGFWHSAWAAIIGLANSGYESLSRGISHTVEFMANMWDGFVTGFKKAWNSTIAFFKRTWQSIKGFFGADVQGEIDRINEELGIANKKLGKESEARKTGRSEAGASERKKSRDFEQLVLDQLAADLAMKLQGTDDGTAAAIATAKQKLEDARAAFIKAKEDGLIEPEGNPGKGKTDAETAAEKLKKLLENLAGATKTKTSGTFSGLQAALGGVGLDKRKVDLLKQIAKNTKDGGGIQAV